MSEDNSMDPTAESATNPNTEDRCVGIIGLGLMGNAIAERFHQAGYSLVVWNRTREKAEPWLKSGAVWSDRPIAACQKIIISLYSSDVVEQVLDSWKSDLTPGKILIDTTTGDPEASLRLSINCETYGVTYIEAPISGSSEQTRLGLATVIAAGPRVGFDACEALWKILGKNVFYVGGSGNGAKMKLVSNLVLGLHRAALAEGLLFGEALGIEPQAALSVLQGSAAYSKQMDAKGPKMVRGDYQVQARLSQHLKDVRLMLQSAERLGVELPLSQTHRELLARAEEQGLGELDNSAIYESMRRANQPNLSSDHS
jgi:3-hydroxyisobutyrate dehydrogenase-like beta-hydroxyacid dehydrogenase